MMAGEIKNTQIRGAFIGNMVEGRISKRVFQENKACQILRLQHKCWPVIDLLQKQLLFFS